MFISVISIGEITHGIAKLPAGPKKTKLTAWLKELTAAGFHNRIIDIDTNVATIWGEMLAKLPNTLPIQDTLIGATALAHNMAVVTHNDKDFKELTGLKIINPWKN